ncbi:GNAT family N-acetyltransferase [Alkalihalobacillus sp. 1P02AB]|uniref:GNAT family N-acetyltransferase n=1 Tax=Alkalihalobacillus sp. 1P02AB TaxID=3132260 RepID=UPI0039A76A79
MQITYSDNKDEINVNELKCLFQRVANWKMPSDINDWIDMNNFTPLLIVALSDNKIIGFARVLTDFVRWGEIYDVVVDEEYQGRGIGTELVKRIINHSKVSRVRTFSLGASNGKGDFYKKLGFQKVNDLGGKVDLNF